MIAADNDWNEDLLKIKNAALRHSATPSGGPVHDHIAHAITDHMATYKS